MSQSDRTPSAAKSPVAGEPGGAATSPGSTTAAHFRDSKIWVEVDAGRSIQFGNVYFPDCDTWVRVDGVLVEVREGQRVEITRDAVTIKELVR